MTCEHCFCAEHEFDDRNAEREKSAYLRDGPRKTTATLLDQLSGHDLSGASLLDIGGGVGPIALELIKAGAERAVLVEASSSSIRAAQSLAAQQSLSDRLETRHGDFLEMHQGIENADIVTLDRVICCYPDGPGLVLHSARRARRWYGVIMPRRTWLTRIGIQIINAILRLRGTAFRTYLHDPGMIDQTLNDEGLALDFSDKNIFWWIVLYRREQEATAG